MKLNADQVKELALAIRTSREHVIQRVSAFDAERRQLCYDTEDTVTRAYEKVYQSIRKEMMEYQTSLRISHILLLIKRYH